MAPHDSQMQARRSTPDESREEVRPALALEDTTAAAPIIAAGETLLALVLEARHPVFEGRVKVRIEHGGAVAERWCATAHGLAIRPADRVLVLRPANAADPIVLGVVDGLAARPPKERAPATLRLQPDETIAIVGQDGTPLVEVHQHAQGGAVVKLAATATELDFGERLTIVADNLALLARRGEMHLKASGDLNAEGLTINLNR